MEVDCRLSGKHGLTSIEAINSQDDDMEANATLKSSAYQFSPGHSRNSSGASNATSPVTSAFSSRSHSRWPSSSSSLVTIPDSPASLIKPSLHDLLEEPMEKDDSYGNNRARDGPLCICDGIFCEHQTSPHSARSFEMMSIGADPRTTSLSPLNDLEASPTSERRRSDGSSKSKTTARISRRWPSISKGWRSRKTSASISIPSFQSAPPSRCPSPRTTTFLAQLSSADADLQAGSQNSALTVLRFNDPAARYSTSSCPDDDVATAVDFTQGPDLVADEQEERSGTPLLPPSTADLSSQKDEDVQSPLQSPRMAKCSPADSVLGSPLPSPMRQTFHSASLSGKASLASLGTGFSKHSALLPDLSPMSTSTGIDEWAIRLGHANFDIAPEPYHPSVCNVETCKLLLEDWRIAQVEYIRQAARVGEHYGQTSRTYKLVCQKWEEIEERWRSNFCAAQEEAASNGETSTLQPLKEAQPFAIPDKFPNIDDADIVGPMVQHPKIEPPVSTAPVLLRIFTDPASLWRKTRV